MEVNPLLSRCKSRGPSVWLQEHLTSPVGTGGAPGVAFGEGGYVIVVAFVIQDL